jgi:hypothetical protein
MMPMRKIDVAAIEAARAGARQGDERSSARGR